MAKLYLDKETGEWGYVSNLVQAESDEFHDVSTRNTAEVIEWLSELSNTERIYVAEEYILRYHH